MLKTVIPLSALMLAVGPSVAYSDFIGIFAGAGAWNADYSSTITQSEVDLDGDLGIDNSTNSIVYVALEHPVPFLPNIKLQSTSLSSDGNGVLSVAFELDNQVFEANDAVSSSVDFSHTDITAYYQVLDTVASVDIGLTARVFDGELSVVSESTNVSAKQNLDFTLPMLYGKAEFFLPLTGLSTSLEAHYVSYSDNTMSDFSAKISYVLPLPSPFFEIGADLGYRRLHFELDENDISDLGANADVSGVFTNLTFHF